MLLYTMDCAHLGAVENLLQLGRVHIHFVAQRRESLLEIGDIIRLGLYACANLVLVLLVGGEFTTMSLKGRLLFSGFRHNGLASSTPQKFRLQTLKFFFELPCLTLLFIYFCIFCL